MRPQLEFGAGSYLSSARAPGSLSRWHGPAASGLMRACLRWGVVWVHARCDAAIRCEGPRDQESQGSGSGKFGLWTGDIGGISFGT